MWSDPSIRRARGALSEISRPRFRSGLLRPELVGREREDLEPTGQHPLYAELTRERPAAQTLPGTDFRAKLAGYGIETGAPPEVLWNFEKFLVGRDGKVIERFAPDVPPDAPMLVAAIEAALGATS